MNTSFNNKTLFSKSSINVDFSNEKNFDNASTNQQVIGNTYTLIDSEFIKKNQGDLAKLKAR